MDRKPTFTLSVDVRLLVERLVEVPVGGTITYSDLGALISRSVQNGARGALTQARRIAQRDHHVVFGVIQNQGLKRLSDAEIVDTGDHVLGTMRRAARRGIKRVASVDFDKLPSDKKYKHNATLAVLGIVDQAASERTAKRLTGMVQQKAAPSTTESMRMLLESFAGKSKD